MTEKRKPYRPPRRVFCDDYVVQGPDEQGETVEFHPHAGEWVDFGYMSDGIKAEIQELGKRYIEKAQAGRDIATRHLGDDGRETEPLSDEETRELNGILDEIKEIRGRIIQLLARTIVGWSWTDDYDRPLPNPANNPGAFLIDDAELWYLVGKAVSPETNPTSLPQS